MIARKGLPEAPLPASRRPEDVEQGVVAATSMPGLSSIAIDLPAGEAPPLPLGLRVPDLG